MIEWGWNEGRWGEEVGSIVLAEELNKGKLSNHTHMANSKQAERKEERKQ